MFDLGRGIGGGGVVSVLGTEGEEERGRESREQKRKEERR